MKSTTPIILFYILYFIWLFTVTYLTPESTLLNYFTVGVAIFYFVLLREQKDWLWFLVSSLIPVIFTMISAENNQLSLRPDLISYIPLWLPLAWGTTVVALRKFYLVVTSS